jgi:hypothetical protein
MRHRDLQKSRVAGTWMLWYGVVRPIKQIYFSFRGSSVTAHCLAATALLTREYQGDYRRQSLTSTASALLTTP